MRRFLSCTAGAVAVFSAIALPLILGVASLGVDVGHWYLTQRKMQGAADAAVISAASAYLSGENHQDVGREYAALHGFCDKHNKSACPTTANSEQGTVIVSPVTGNKIVVDIAQVHQPLLWSPTLMKLVVEDKKVPCGNVDMHLSDLPACLKAHAAVKVKTPTQSGGNGCLLGLSRTETALIVAGNGKIDAPNCVAASDTCGGRDANSCPLTGLAMNGNAVVKLKELNVATESAFICPTADANICNIDTSITTYPFWTRDPFATYVMPTPGSCMATPSADLRGVTVYEPGTYCGGISISGKANVIFNPGIYILVDGDFSVSGGTVNQRTVASTTVLTLVRATRTTTW